MASPDYPAPGEPDEPLDWPRNTGPDAGCLAEVALAAALAGVVLFFVLYG